MNVFEIQRRLVDDYKSYVESFVSIRDPRVRRFVEREYADNKYWPEALVQLNPAFEAASSVEQLVQDGVLHHRCADIFRLGDERQNSMRLHRHQEDAIHKARERRSYVLTTGTGSGKSLAYFIPIIDRILRGGSGAGLKAIVVYPMNALCNSQLEELEKFLGPSATSPVTYRRYTGQESEEDRQQIRANPPDILLTNYVMLELILTRTEDKPLLDKAGGLGFLVLDELHTYRGRQGADVSMLARRVRERTGADGTQCVGTSATMATEGTRANRQAEVARVASTLFGTDVEPNDVIDETLSPLFPSLAIASHALRAATMRAAEQQLPQSVDAFLADPLAAWIERAFGAEERDGHVARLQPITISEGATRLAEATELGPAIASGAIRAMLMRGYELAHPDTRRPLFAFRLHQFISRGDTVFSTLERGERREMTLDGQTTLPSDVHRRLYPLAFCRNCGEEYFVIDMSEGIGPSQLKPRDFRDMASQDDDDRASGYLWLDSATEAAANEEPFAFQAERIPDQHLTVRSGDEVGPTSQLQKRLIPAEVDEDGAIRLFEGDGPSAAWFIRGRLPFCLHCGDSWEPNVSEFTKLGTLASEGRAGATTIISLKLVQALRASEDLPFEARKLLSFTDNRQDASLQAGHFNDFIVTSMLRAGILASLPTEGTESFDSLPNGILQALNLPHRDYAAPGVSGFLADDRARAVLRDVLAYRMLRDLRRGWRVNQPNLEQLGLLAVDYYRLDDLASMESFWNETLLGSVGELRHSRKASESTEWLQAEELDEVLGEIVNLVPEKRLDLLTAVLDHFRREGSIQARVLTEHELSALKDRAVNNLNDLWGFDESETPESAKPLQVRRSQRRGNQKAVDLTPLSRTGRAVAQPRVWGRPQGAKPIDTNRRLLVLHVLVHALATSGHLVAANDGEYLLAADVLKWRRGQPEDGNRTNAFFRDFYRTLADALPISDSPVNIRGMQAREHTAQVPAGLRRDREQNFRDGNLPVMYSSPTMELGVDISSLNAVNMRNVPPTPANYAQRSGRAGRANQPAIVVTYCAAFSPHDQYYFHRRQEMVAGVVTPPRIDLVNRDLIASHMHAVWLAETGARLHSSLGEVLELTGESTALPVQEELAKQLANEAARKRAQVRCERILANLEDDLSKTKWYRPGWLDMQLSRAPQSFDEACDRWRSLYRSAVDQVEIQGKRANNLALTRDERDRADRLYSEARRQRELLVDRQSMSNDFYTYRYLASEGFLPGYNFPRLPLTAYIPGRRGDRTDGEYLQRSRFIAISEYGPGNSIYYEGNRYRVERIAMPTSSEPDASVTETIKVCEKCGYAHTASLANADVCANPTCGAVLDGSFHKDNLIRLQSVVTRRVERISSEEEERQRQGFDLKTAIQFGTTPQGPDFERGTLQINHVGIEADIVYAPSAQIWQINLGWRRRKDKHSHGFWLDMNRGVWSRREDPGNEKGTESPEVNSGDLKRVVPYVDDRQNALLLTLQREGLRRLKGEQSTASTAHYLSLGYALKRGICVAFQLEESELDMEPMPDATNPHSLLLVESSEGGAGVLTRLLEEPGAMARVARAASEVLHFDPDTGADHGLEANCGIACYQCLLSYTNQTDHDHMNRYLVRDILRDWQQALVTERSHAMTREELREELKKLIQSSLEAEFIDWLYDHGYRLPDKAQVLIDDPYARPDFFFEIGKGVLVYVDGPSHEGEAAKQRDDIDRRKLERSGYQVVSVTYPDRWADEVADWPDVFGEGVKR